MDPTQAGARPESGPENLCLSVVRRCINTAEAKRAQKAFPGLESGLGAARVEPLDSFLPWLNHFLAILRRAYGEFEQRAGQVKAPRGAKTELLRQTIETIAGDFTVAELERLCPGISRDHLRRSLKQMKAAGLITCLGLGPGAKWRKQKEGQTSNFPK
jgi:hypothetical protein